MACWQERPAWAVGPCGAACRFFTILYGAQEKRRQAKAFPFEGKVAVADAVTTRARLTQARQTDEVDS